MKTAGNTVVAHLRDSNVSRVIWIQLITLLIAAQLAKGTVQELSNYVLAARGQALQASPDVVQLRARRQLLQVRF